MSTMPQAKGFPIVGNLPGLLGNRPEFLLQQAVRHGNMVQLDFAGRQVVLVADPERVQDVLVRRKADFVKGERGRRVASSYLGNSLLVSVGDYHAKQRKMIQPAFHATRIQGYAEGMVESTDRAIATWEDGAVRDVHTDMMQLTMEIVAQTLFGNAVADDAIQVGESISTIQRNGADMLRRIVDVPYWLRKDFYDREAAANETLERLISRFIHERHAQGLVDTGDLLSMLLLSEDDDGQRMTDQEVRDEAVTLFAAGHETTSNALTWTWYLLAQHPDVAATLHHELDTVLAGRLPTLEDLRQLPYTHQVIKEAMRLYPPAWTLMVREAVRDTQLGPYTIPQGWAVFISPYVLHRYPELWHAPDLFLPERFAPECVADMHRYQYIPFGGGAHVCIGNSFAMMEAALVLATVASRFSMTLVPGQDVTPLAEVTLQPRDGLCLRVHVREHSKSRAE